MLRRARVVAVLGAHAEARRPAHYVPAYLQAQGYRIIPVNPKYAGQVLFGARVVPSLLDIEVPVDLVDVFRPAASLPSHLPEILGMTPRPPVVWFQLGIRNEAVADALVAASIDVVQDRCTLADHRRWGLPARGD